MEDQFPDNGCDHMSDPKKDAVELLVQAARVAIMSAADRLDGRPARQDVKALKLALEKYETTHEPHDHECG